MSSWDTHTNTASTSTWGTSSGGWGTAPPSGGVSSGGWGTPSQPSQNSEKPVKKKRFRIRKRVWIPAVVVTALVSSYFGIVFAPPISIDVPNRGTTALDGYLTPLKSFDVDKLKSQFEDSWVAQEQAYLNNSEVRTAFVKKVLSSVSYKVPEGVQHNWAGLTARSPWNWEVRRAPITLNNKEKAAFSYIDYSAIKFQDSTLKKILEEVELSSVKDVDYKRKVTDAYAQYISGLEELPLTTVERTPEMECVEESPCKVTLKEDAFWDSTLFGSDEFGKSQEDFAVTVAKMLDPNGESTYEEVEDKPEESEQPQEQSTEGTENSDKQEEDKSEAVAKKKVLRDYFHLEKSWVGAFRLSQQVGSDGKVSKVLPRVGDGSFDSPAGLDTPVLTKYNDKPIEVSLQKFIVNKDAFTEMMKRSQQNRGFVESSDVKYAYYEFKVKNRSEEPLTISAKDLLVDANVNKFNRTGTVYGLTSEVKELKPDEEAVLESWTSSIRLSELYLVWKSAPEPIWFRVLAADPSTVKEEGK